MCATEKGGIERLYVERESCIYGAVVAAYPHSLAAFLFGATVLLEADNGAAQQTDGALLGHLVAVEARSFVVVLQAAGRGGEEINKIRSSNHQGGTSLAKAAAKDQSINEAYKK